MSGSATCRSCGRPIVWAVSNRGRNIPLDPEPTERGNLIRLSSMQNGKLQFDALPFDPKLHRDDAPRYISHFVTCPHAAQHRRSR